MLFVNSLELLVEFLPINLKYVVVAVGVWKILIVSRQIQHILMPSLIFTSHF